MAVKKETFNIWASCGKLQILLIYGDKKQIEALQELIWEKKGAVDRSSDFYPQHKRY